MKLRLTLVFIPILLASCGSQHAQRTAVDGALSSPAAKVAENPLQKNFKFSLFISASGNEELTDTGTKPFDAWTVDTNGAMNVRVSRRKSGRNFDNLSALATLDPPDMDTLRQLLRAGRLFEIDSSDLTQQCMGNEHYIVRIVPLDVTVQSVSISFDACAADYNLLPEPQRRYFRKFIDWWERMRIKYRPG